MNLLERRKSETRVVRTLPQYNYRDFLKNNIARDKTDVEWMFDSRYIHMSISYRRC